MTTILRFLGFNLPIISDADLAKIDATVATDEGCMVRMFVPCSSCKGRKNMLLNCVCQ